MQYMLLIYEDEQVYGTDKDGPAIQEIVARHMAFSKELGSARVGGAGLKATSAATPCGPIRAPRRCTTDHLLKPRSSWADTTLSTFRIWTPPSQLRRSYPFCRTVPSKYAR